MQVYLPEDMFQDLKHASIARDTSMSDLIRSGLNHVLYPPKDNQFDPLLDFVGQAKPAKKTNAVQAVKDLYQ
jgi:hypothetical protein